MIEDYVVIDLEMTGLDAKTDKILELGAVKVRRGEILASFSKIINPETELSQKVAELTGITNEAAAAGAPMDETLFHFLEFLGEDVLVGHNIIFDYRFLKQWAVNHKISFERNAVDTLKLARKFLQKEQKKDLESLCSSYAVERRNAHRALDDARATAEIFKKLIMEFGDRESEAFAPKPLIYKTKKQTPATERQKEYLMRCAAYHGLKDFALPVHLTRSEASRLVDRLIAEYGKLPKETFSC